jgi:hypothetical protein
VRLYEDRHEGESWILWKLGNWTALPQEWIKSVGFAWGFQRKGVWDWKPVITGNDSLYFNAILFVRLVFPLGVFVGIRWSGSTTKAALWQGGMFWKLNGRFALTFRVQSDDSAAAGTNSPNYFDGRGWEYGSH